MNKTKRGHLLARKYHNYSVIEVNLQQFSDTPITVVSKKTIAKEKV